MTTTHRPAPADPALVLLVHDRWATGLVFDACAALSDEQLDRVFEMGLGTLRATLTHSIGAMRGWTDLLDGVDGSRPRLESTDKRSVAELRTLYDEAADEFFRAARAEPFANVVKAARGGRELAFSRGGILAHVTTHSVHHRAQILNMLRRLGVDPVPNPSVMAWMVENPSV